MIPSISGMLMSIRTTSGQQAGRHLQRLGAGRGRPDDLHVLLEAEKLGQVVARLRDVVDDEDADLVGHRPDGLRTRGWMDSVRVVGAAGTAARHAPAGQVPATALGTTVSTTCGGMTPYLSTSWRSVMPVVSADGAAFLVPAGERRTSDRLPSICAEPHELGLLWRHRQEDDLLSARSGLASAWARVPPVAVPVDVVGGGRRVPTTLRFWTSTLTVVAVEERVDRLEVVARSWAAGLPSSGPSRR